MIFTAQDAFCGPDDTNKLIWLFFFLSLSVQSSISQWVPVSVIASATALAAHLISLIAYKIFRKNLFIIDWFFSFGSRLCKIMLFRFESKPCGHFMEPNYIFMIIENPRSISFFFLFYFFQSLSMFTFIEHSFNQTTILLGRMHQSLFSLYQFVIIKRSNEDNYIK